MSHLADTTFRFAGRRSPVGSRRIVELLLACLLMASLQLSLHAEAEDLPLPKWSADELRTFREFGLPNLPTEPLLPTVSSYMTDSDDFLQSGPRLEDIPAELNGDITPRLRVEDLGSFLPDSSERTELRGPHTDAVPRRTTATTDLSPEFLQAASEALRAEYLIDPDVLVPEMIHLQMMRFLDFHASDARIKLYVLAIDADKRIPANAGLERLASGGLINGAACLLVYPLKEPWRARIFMSKSIIEQTSSTYLSETTRSCLAEALNSSDSYDQLQTYAMELSTRLFWLQKALKLESPSTTQHTLSEFAPVISERVPDSAADAAATTDSSVPWWTASLCFLAASGGTAGFILKRRQRKKKHPLVWILPEPEPKTRLGGTFSGGGAMAHW